MPKSQFKVAIKNRVNVTNAVDGALELYFLDEIADTVTYDWFCGYVETDMVADTIAQVKNFNPSRIICYIDSCGGDLGIAISLYNFLKNYNAKVEVEIIGMCMSAATIIAAAASKGKLRAPKNSFYVIHQASGCTEGTSDEIRQYADVVDRYTEQVADILSQRNTKGMTAEAVAALWAAGDCWMTGGEAFDAGFVDEVYNGEAINVTNCITAAKKVYNNIPERILAMQAEQQTTETAGDTPSIANDLKKLFMDFKGAITNFVKDIKDVKTPTNSSNAPIDFAGVLEAPITNMVNTLHTEITNEISGIEERVTNILEGKYNAKLESMEKTITDLQADIVSGKGGEAKPKNSGDAPAPFGYAVNKKVNS